MNKALILAAMLVAPAFADSTHDNGHGADDCILGGNCATGPQGPQGLPGTSGTNGVNGANGSDGKDGKDGLNGKDTTRDSQLVMDAAVRLYDGKRIQIQAFSMYGLGGRPGQDLIGNGRHLFYGARVVLKLGTSYEERQIQELKKMIAELSAKGGKK